MIESSPIASTFAITKDVLHKSPAPAIIPRAQPSRGRRNSTQSILPDARKRPSSSTSSKAPNGIGVYGTTTEIEKVPGLAGRSVVEVKTATRESLIAKGDNLVEEISSHDGAADIRSLVPVGVNNKASERPLKCEEIENGNGNGKTRPDRPPSISVATRGGKLSKTTTPLNTSFSEPPPRSRPSRTIEPPVKRSHKKGAGLAAQLAAAAAAANYDEEATSIHGDEEEEDDDSEPRYCYCNQVSYGEMVACDMETCAREWFHLDCVGLAKAPTKNGKSFCRTVCESVKADYCCRAAKWFCDECKEQVKKGKTPTTTTTPTTSGTVR